MKIKVRLMDLLKINAVLTYTTGGIDVSIVNVGRCRESLRENNIENGMAYVLFEPQ